MSRKDWGFWVPRAALCNVWQALGGSPGAFERWMEEPKRTPADAWAALMAWVRGRWDPNDANPPAGPHPRETLP